MSDYIKDGVYYAVDAVKSELEGRMIYGFHVKENGGNPFAPDMPSGFYGFVGWGREAHVNIDYGSAIGWKNIPKGVEYFIISGYDGCFAVTAEHARREWMPLYSAWTIKDVATSIASEVYDAAKWDEIEEINVDESMEEVAEWDEEAA